MIGKGNGYTPSSSNRYSTSIATGSDAYFGVRHVQVVLLFLVLFVGYASRIILSVAIVAMTDHTTTDNPNVPTYKWDDKSVVLSSYNWGFIILQTLGGPIEKSFNLHRFFIIAMVINSLACMFIPLSAQYLGSWGVIGLRFTQGLASGILCPFVHTLLGRWVPTSERSRFGTFVYAGTSLAAILAMIITGVLASSWIGWPSAFYLFGTAGFIWAILYAFLGSSSPAEHRSISKEEKYYIEKSLGNEEEKQIPIPVKDILTSLPFWAILVANCGQDWGYNTLLTEIPNYLHHVMHFEIKSNSLVSAAPYFILMILCFVFGPISDFVINRRICSREKTRKIFNTIGLCIPAVALIALGYIPDDMPWLTVFTLIIAVGLNAGIFAGYQVNHIDLSPNHAGTLMGWTNGPGNVFSFLGPLSVQAIVKDETNKSQWCIVFIISASISVAAAIFYIIFAKGEVQYWNDLDEHKKNEKKKADLM